MMNLDLNVLVAIATCLVSTTVVLWSGGRREGRIEGRIETMSRLLETSIQYVNRDLEKMRSDYRELSGRVERTTRQAYRSMHEED